MESIIFNKKHVDFTKEPLFFGSGKIITRTDIDTEPYVARLTEEILGKFWRHTDITYNNDTLDFKTMPEPLKDMFLKNFKFQSLMDSVVTRTAGQIFMPITNNPALEIWFNVFQFTETLHSISYGAMLKTIKPDANKDFDDIMVNPNILDRVESITKYYDKLDELNYVYRKTGVVTDEHRETLILSVVATYLLEGVLFQNSFALTFGFDQNDLMKDISKTIKLINL